MEYAVHHVHLIILYSHTPLNRTDEQCAFNPHECVTYVHLVLML